MTAPITSKFRWRLILAFPGVEKEGLRKSYGKIGSVLDQIPDELLGVRLSNIGIVRPDDRLISALRNGRWRKLPTHV
jgi:hypothetical protein